MTDEEDFGNKWTVDTSRIDLLARIEGLDERYKVLFEGMQRELTTGFSSSKDALAVALVPVKEALVQARSENDKRFDDQRKEADTRDRVMSDKLDALTLIVTATQASTAAVAASQQNTKNGNQWSITTMIAFLSLIASISVMVFVGVHG